MYPRPHDGIILMLKIFLKETILEVQMSDVMF